MKHLPRQRVAVVGAGISGLSAAWLLRERHDVTLFEADSRAGGHADTQTVKIGGVPVAVDTGFIVYNTENYPHLTNLFAALGIVTRPSEMSFAVSIGGGAFEYGGGEIAQLFAQRRNVLRPRLWRMLRDILRFYREAPALLDSADDPALGEWLARNGYSAPFVEDHILPMGAAIWSASIDAMRAFPARQFVRFFHNHGLLRLRGRPQWRTVAGGAHSYVRRMLDDLSQVKLGCRIVRIARENGVTLHFPDGASARFDQAVLACHADQALSLLDAPTQRERKILGAMRSTENIAVLHTDRQLMPRRRAVWSAWNYVSDGADHAQNASVTYWMNRLQALPTEKPLFVSLNPRRAPAPGSVLATRTYRHPQFDAAALRAQADLPRIQGENRLWFAGAWTGWGFHEDGIASAVRIARSFGAVPPWQEAVIGSMAA